MKDDRPRMWIEVPVFFPDMDPFEAYPPALSLEQTDDGLPRKSPIHSPSDVADY